MRIVQLGTGALEALADGDLAAAQACAELPLTPWLAGPDCRWLWRMRADQVRADPRDAAWVTGVVVDAVLGRAVGRAGFHGRPDGSGTVEVGYAIDPVCRRRGYARAALETLLGRAADEPTVRTVRATITPANTASLALVARYGFVEVGEQWDDRDGLETVFEVVSRGRPAPRRR